ncbi:hypothetical protein [Streptomyces mirabilis]|uniref:hypothetical protein n=1 Tax=Streptomyces mirabilis TaxID=68239 RepID=UPI0033A39557
MVEGRSGGKLLVVRASGAHCENACETPAAYGVPAATLSGGTSGLAEKYAAAAHSVSAGDRVRRCDMRTRSAAQA